MTAGRPRKPTVLKVVEGNRGKRRLPEGEPMPAPAELAPPYWLRAPARRVWMELAPEVHAQGLLTKLDVELFAYACAEAARARRGDRKAEELTNKILAKFGMSPADRTKVMVRPKSADPFDTFLEKAR